MAMVAVVLMATGACGEQHDTALVETNVDAHALADAADHTTQASTGKVHVTVTTTSPASAGSGTAGDAGGVTMTSDAAYDRAADLMSMTSVIHSNLSGVQAPLDSTLGGSLDMHEEVIVHGKVSYLRMQGSPSSSVRSKMFSKSGDKWIKTDMSVGADPTASDDSNSLPGQLNPIGDPSEILAYLKGVGADVTTVGHEAIDGVDTTHVHATVSMQQVIEAAGADAGKVTDSLKELLGGSADALSRATLPVDVFIGNDHYVRRIVITFDMGDAANALGLGSPDTDPTHASGDSAASMAGASSTMTLDYRDLGQPVDITEPAAADTISMCDLMAQQSAIVGSGIVVDHAGC